MSASRLKAKVPLLLRVSDAGHGASRIAAIDRPASETLNMNGLVDRSKASFDHLVSACEHSVRNIKAERLGGLEVEGEERAREN
jgi:hypothetical protein